MGNKAKRKNKQTKNVVPIIYLSIHFFLLLCVYVSLPHDCDVVCSSKNICETKIKHLEVRVCVLLPSPRLLSLTPVFQP